MDFCVVVESYGTKKLVEKVFYTQKKERWLLLIENQSWHRKVINSAVLKLLILSFLLF